MLKEDNLQVCDSSYFYCEKKILGPTPSILLSEKPRVHFSLLLNCILYKRKMAGTYHTKIKA